MHSRVSLSGSLDATRFLVFTFFFPERLAWQVLRWLKRLPCPDERAKPGNPRNFSKEYRRAAKAAGVDATFHTLRHTHASELLRKGIPIAVVSKRLGHSKISTTLDIYTHCLPDEQDQAASVMDATLGGL